MKKIRLTINGDISFVIEECEGEAEIRREHAGKSTAGRCVDDTLEWKTKIISVRVERIE